jgi:hypothetical protein
MGNDYYDRELSAWICRDCRRNTDFCRCEQVRLIHAVACGIGCLMEPSKSVVGKVRRLRVGLEALDIGVRADQPECALLKIGALYAWVPCAAFTSKSEAN